MSNIEHAMFASHDLRSGPSRRSMLSLFPAALFAGWLGLGRRSKTGLATPEHSAPAAAAEKSVPMYSYASEPKGAEAWDCAVPEPVRTVAVYDEQDRLIRYTVIHPGGGTEVHTYYYLPDAPA